MGNALFPILSHLYRDLYNKVKKEKLVCDACQFGKQTRSSYVPSDNRSATPLEVIHSDVWGPSGVSALNGYRSFVTFIDCCTRVTWVYVLKNKDDVFECFVDFHNMIKTQYNACMNLIGTCPVLGLFIRQLIQVPLNKMAWLKGKIDIFWRLPGV